MSYSNGPKLVTNGLVLYLDAGNPKSYAGSGTNIYDLSVSRASGSLQNGTAFSSSTGKGSLVFDGVDDVVSTNISGTFTAMTMMCYVKRNGSQPGWAGIFYARNGSASNAAGLDFLGNSNTLTYTWNTTYGFNTNLIIPDAQWCMIGMSLGSTKTDLYLNDSVATDTTSNSSFAIGSGDLKLGLDSTAFGGLVRFFKGNIGLAMMYNRALSQQEVLQNYNSTKGRFGL